MPLSSNKASLIDHHTLSVQVTCFHRLTKKCTQLYLLKIATIINKSEKAIICFKMNYFFVLSLTTVAFTSTASCAAFQLSSTPTFFNRQVNQQQQQHWRTNNNSRQPFSSVVPTSLPFTSSSILRISPNNINYGNHGAESSVGGSTTGISGNSRTDSKLYVSTSTEELSQQQPSSISSVRDLNNVNNNNVNDNDNIIYNEKLERIEVDQEEIEGQFQSIMKKVYEKIGSIDDERYSVPEYSTGEVPRVFSSLQYTRDANTGKVISATHAAGSILGAAALITGTTIGAGVLALPAATVSAGFLPSTVAMGVAYGYMVVSGLLIAELSLNRMGNSGRTGTGLLDLYQHSLGTPTSQIGTIAYFFLHYAMMVAYIAQGGLNLNTILPDIGGSIESLGQIIFATVCGLTLYTVEPKIMEKINNALVIGVLGTFAAIMSSIAGTADYSALIDFSNQKPEEIVNCFPILFLAFVYQNVVPTVVTQLEGDRKKIITSILLGTAVPFLMFFSWNAVVLGNVLAAGIDPSSGIDPVALLQNGVFNGNNEFVGPLVTVFSTTAILTSIVGFTHGLVESWQDVLKINQPKGKVTSTAALSSSTDSSDVSMDAISTTNYRPLLFGLVFVPPLIMSILDPNVFFNALEYGGAFGVSTLFLILPPIMVWKQRYGNTNKDTIQQKEPVLSETLTAYTVGDTTMASSSTIISTNPTTSELQPEPLLTKPMVPFGKIPLGSMWKAAGTLIIEQGAEKLGFFEWVEQVLHSVNI